MDGKNPKLRAKVGAEQGVVIAGVVLLLLLLDTAGAAARPLAPSRCFTAAAFGDLLQGAALASSSMRA